MTANAPTIPAVSTAPQGARRLFSMIDGTTATPLAKHRLRYAPPPQGARAHKSILNSIEASGLRGRGGAGFPTGTKMRAVVANRRTPVVVVNGTEGEPISWKDATLLELQPHLVLDGAAFAAAAVGADSIHLCIERGNTNAARAIARALEERAIAEPRAIQAQLHLTPPRYVAGEESALVHWLNGGDAKPTRVPPRPFERGVANRPTLVNNVETIAHITQIMQYGPAWFRTIGTDDEPGTVLASVSGAVAQSAVYEAPIGAKASDLLQLARPTHGVRAVLVGGYFGTWFGENDLVDLRLSNAWLRPRGGGLGCAAVAVLPAHGCGVIETARVMRWMAAETAGQCGACVNGLDAIAGALREIANSRATPGTLSQLEHWARQVDGRGACRFPDGAIRFLNSALNVFATEIADHLRGRPCEAARAPRTLPIPKIVEGWQ